MIWHEIKYLPERSHTRLGSPSLVRLPDGALLATHDYFGPGCPRNHEREESLTSVYRSEDNGATWQNITHIMNCYWSSLFVHQGSVYILGTSQQYGSIYIRRSDDGGFTWTHPADAEHGLLYQGGYYHDAPSFHCAPVPVVFHEGRVYKAFEDCDPCVWGTGFQACVVSAPADADLLNAANWTMSNKIPFDPAWTPAEWGDVSIPGWREGNVVVAPDGQLWNILTFEAKGLWAEKAPRIKIEDEGKRITFDPATGFIDFPGCKAKFSIRRDPVTGKYLSLVNNLASLDLLKQMAESSTLTTRVHRHHPARQRNIVNLTVSDDLWNWRVVKTLVSDDTGLSPEDSIRLTGFQYVDWQFDGGDLIYAVRTAYRGALNFHDSNRILYCVEKDFRRLL
ncbi:MAG: glycoside hydrolase [Anaerolineae bacterium]|nr:glycoside hydrolase [Anaerolineae bacterium]